MKKKERLKMSRVCFNEFLQHLMDKRITVDDVNNFIAMWVKCVEREGKEAEFSFSYCVMNPKNDYEVTDSAHIVYALKDTILISIEDLKEHINKEEDDFINWSLVREESDFYEITTQSEIDDNINGNC
jgi:hypothetical protein